MSRLVQWVCLTLVPLALALAVAMALGAALMWLAVPGTDPWEAYSVMTRGALGTPLGVSWVCYHTTPLILTGLAVAIAFRAGLFNIGGEGQMVVGGLAATLVATHLDWPAWCLLPLCAAAAALAGGVWGLIPGVLKAWRGAHEVINTIMMNFIAVGLTQYLVTTRFAAASGGVVQTDEIAAGAQIPRLHGVLPYFDASTPVGWMLPVALTGALACWAVLRFGRWGFELRAFGLAPEAAENAGIRGKRVTALAMLAAGALAGLAALALIHGDKHRFGQHVFVAGYGFLGIAVALLARNHPLGVVPAALLFGFLFAGTAEIEFSTEVPRDVITVLQGLVILAVVVANELFARWFSHRWRRP